MERLCHIVGFSTEQTAKLMLGEKIEHNGTLYSEEYKRNFATDKVTAQIVTDSTVGKNKLMLIINQKTYPIGSGSSLANFIKGYNRKRGRKGAKVLACKERYFAEIQ